ncbi:MAG TPA: TolC family protein, partial [Silvibacterium sp.]|nr:TolC family protein [Silvibacterium sp.]
MSGFRMHERICAAALCVAFAPYGVGQTQQQSAPPPAPNAPAQTTPAPQPAPTIAQQAQQAQQVQPVAVQAPFHVELPHSRNPFRSYTPSTVPPLNLTNSPRLQNLVRDGKLYISLRDAIALALENNLDLAYFRYNFPAAQADLLRTKAGGQVNGVNTNIAQGTQGGFSSSGVGGGGGASSGVVAAGTGGIVTSTLGSGAPVPSFDPALILKGFVDHQTLTQINPIQSGVPILKNNTIEFESGYSQAFSTGTNFSVSSFGYRQTTNSIFNVLSPQITT